MERHNIGSILKIDRYNNAEHSLKLSEYTQEEKPSQTQILHWQSQLIFWKNWNDMWNTNMNFQRFSTQPYLILITVNEKDLSYSYLLKVIFRCNGELGFDSLSRAVLVCRWNFASLWLSRSSSSNFSWAGSSVLWKCRNLRMVGSNLAERGLSIIIRIFANRQSLSRNAGLGVFQCQQNAICFHSRNVGAFEM